MLEFNLEEVFERNASNIKLSSFLNSKSSFKEFALRLYAKFGKDKFEEFVTLVEDSKSVSDFAEKFFNQFMVPYSTVSSLFDYTVENSVNQINSLKEESRKRLWSEFSEMNKLDIWSKPGINRLYSVGLMLNNVEVIKWGEMNDKLQPKVLNNDKCLLSIKEYVGELPSYENIKNIPVIVVYHIIQYLYDKWSKDEEIFHYDPNNLSYISYIQTLCKVVFVNANIENDNPSTFFVYALAVTHKDVMAIVYQNYVTGKEEAKREKNVPKNPNPGSIFPVVRNAKQAEYFIRYIYYELRFKYNPYFGLEDYFNIGDVITTNIGVDVEINEVNIKQFNANIKKCFELLGNKKVYELCNKYFDEVNGEDNILETATVKNLLINPDSAFPVVKNAKQAESFLRYVYLELRMNFHPESYLEDYFNIGDVITTNAGADIKITEANAKQFNENIEKCFEILGEEKVYDLCDTYLKELNGWNKEQETNNDTPEKRWENFLVKYSSNIQKLQNEFSQLDSGESLSFPFEYTKEENYVYELKRSDHVHQGMFRKAYILSIYDSNLKLVTNEIYYAFDSSKITEFLHKFFVPNIGVVENVMKGPREVTIDDLDSFVALLNQTWGISDSQAKQNGTVYTRWFNYEMGKKYCRVTTGSYNQKGFGSAYCFIDLANGNIHKANGYKAPDKKHVRGNIFGENPLIGLNEYGVNYLR